MSQKMHGSGNLEAINLVSDAARPLPLAVYRYISRCEVHRLFQCVYKLEP
jgi:hypothetical protein